MKIFASAKVNLCLDILKQTDSGYHKIQTVLYEFPLLKNEIIIKEVKKEEEAEGKNSLANKAYEFLKEKYKIKQNLSIGIKRGIPFSSGLGGETSNVVAVLKHLNKVWELNLSKEELKKIATNFGMDAPFFIEGGMAIGTNFGEKITPLPNISLPFKIFVKSSSDKDKTKKAYGKIDLNLCGKNTGKTEELIKAIKRNDVKAIKQNLHNDFETITPVPKGFHLSGSGPSYFSL